MLNFLYSVSSWCYVSHSHSFPNLEAKMVMIDLLITVLSTSLATSKSQSTKGVNRDYPSLGRIMEAGRRWQKARKPVFREG